MNKSIDYNEKLHFHFHPKQGWINDPNGLVIERTGREALVYEGVIDDLKILRDAYMAEIFVNGGRDVYTVLL